MPKRRAPTRTYSPHFPSQIILNVTNDTRQKLIAIAYQMGQKGMYSRPSKLFLEGSVEKYIAELSDVKRREFNEILRNVVIQEQIV